MGLGFGGAVVEGVGVVVVVVLEAATGIWVRLGDAGGAAAAAVAATDAACVCGGGPDRGADHGFFTSSALFSAAYFAATASL